ncbi:MAG: hypothetical protein ABI405_10800 [Parafilimonas sp.]
MQNSTFKETTKACLYKTRMLLVLLGEGYIVFILFIAVAIVVFISTISHLPFLLMGNSKISNEVLHSSKFKSIKEMPKALFN